MATRQKPVTEPVLDNSFEKEFPSDPTNKVELAFTEPQFNSIIRNIKNKPVDAIRPLLHETFHTLKRLGVNRDLEAAVPGIPKGSDHFDFLTFKTWLSKLKKSDTQAIVQLVEIDATAKVRVSS